MKKGRHISHDLVKHVPQRGKGLMSDDSRASGGYSDGDSNEVLIRGEGMEVFENSFDSERRC